MTSSRYSARWRYYWVHHIWLDIVPAAAVIAVWSLLARQDVVPFGLSHVPPDTRRALYQSLSSIAATMGGVTLTSISLLLNLIRVPTGPVELPAADERRIGQAFLGVLPWQGALFAGALIAITMDATRSGGYPWLQIVLLALATAGLCSIGRVFWILRRLLGATARRA
ncbi:hypothetical protein A5784_03035 [Mycobacterium sp. 852013-50091_SCH5140682]|uniref:hypothetical protein n=1 Tax=Mycobacterium sp. 852013-50091_SCH5140682 TaxID=1834109 RepID=UPI0007EBAB06|nr:hypothetical protein [Mycobacterium sp. 852013-50091_SCH5140682]OBC15400.1 hypothetical protein A5784_03035 [Mycobacterium sp. 852013-50091_SCH5140682]